MPPPREAVFRYGIRKQTRTGGGQKKWTTKWLPDGLQTSRESIRTNSTLRNSLVTTRKSVNLTLWAKIDPQKSENRPSKRVLFFLSTTCSSVHASTPSRKS